MFKKRKPITPDDVQKLIDEYFESAERYEKNKDVNYFQNYLNYTKLNGIISNFKYNDKINNLNSRIDDLYDFKYELKQQLNDLKWRIATLEEKCQKK